MVFNLYTQLSRRAKSALVFFSYLLCSCIFTYPLITRLTTHVPGEAEGDVPYYIWNLWWMKRAVLTGDSLFFTEHIFAPNGISLAFHAFVFAKSFVSIPFQFLLSPWAVYNLLILLTFTIAACCMFLLARHCTGDNIGAWIAGLVYGFSPYMLARGTGHLNYLSAEWIPLYVLCLMRFCDEGNVRWSIAAAICLLLTAYSEYYYLIYLTMFTVGYLVHRYGAEPSLLLQRNVYGGLLLMGGLVAAGFSPILWLLISQDSGFLYGGWSGSAKLGADLLAFVVPPPDSWFYGDWGRDLYLLFSGGNPMEATVFAGYVALTLSVWCGGRLWRRREVRLWVIVTLVFAILSLGPLLHIGGDFVFGAGPIRFALPLPYIAIHYIPLLKGARVPARFDIMVQLGLALLCAFALTNLLYRVRRRRLLGLVVALFIFLEYFRTPYPNFHVNIPPVYREIALDHRDVGILDIPLGWRTGWGSTGRSLDRQQIYQVIHEKRIIGGFVSRIPESELNALISLPGVARLLDLQENVILPSPPTAVRRDAIRQQMIELIDHLPNFVVERVLRDSSVRNFMVGSYEGDKVDNASRSTSGSLRDLVDRAQLGYVVVHPPYSRETDIIEYIEGNMSLERFYDRDGVVAYRVVQ